MVQGIGLDTRAARPSGSLSQALTSAFPPPALSGCRPFAASLAGTSQARPVGSVDCRSWLCGPWPIAQAPVCPCLSGVALAGVSLPPCSAKSSLVGPLWPLAPLSFCLSVLRRICRAPPPQVGGLGELRAPMGAHRDGPEEACLQSALWSDFHAAPRCSLPASWSGLN